MATILEFRAAERDKKGKPARRRRKSAEIVIFPGVRYERAVNACDSGSKIVAVGNRDILQLAE